jgi:hypothetical protein
VLLIFGLIGLITPLLLLTVKEPARIVTTDAAPGSVRGFVKENGRSLLPLYLGCGLLAIGNYGLVSWVPSVLIRRFEWRPDAVGLAFGFITALAGILGSVSGGTLSDVGGAPHGARRTHRCGLAGPAYACLDRDFAAWSGVNCEASVSVTAWLVGAVAAAFPLGSTVGSHRHKNC